MLPALIVVAIAALHAGVASAQEVRQDDLDRCAALASAAEKLACFEALTTAGRTPDTELFETSPPPPAASPAPAPETPPARPAEPVPAEAVVDKPPERSPAPASPVPATTTASELGAEQLKRPDDEASDEPATATVVKVTEGPRGNLYFHLDNGQVWRQIEARRFRYPKNQEFGILISQGIMGDYRLRVTPDSAAARIRRIE